MHWRFIAAKPPLTWAIKGNYMEPEQRLWIAIVLQAVMDDDTEYLNSAAFEHACQLAGTSSNVARAMEPAVAKKGYETLMRTPRDAA